MDNFISFINQPASPMFIMIGMGLAGFTVIGFAFFYDWYETRKSNESKKGIWPKVIFKLYSVSYWNNPSLLYNITCFNDTRLNLWKYWDTYY